MEKLVTGLKQIAEIVISESNHQCEVCGDLGVDLHHLIGGRGKRTQHQNQYSVILLCKECHQGTYGIHGKFGRPLDIDLKLQLQDKYKSLGYTQEQIRKLMGGRIYSLEDKESKV